MSALTLHLKSLEDNDPWVIEQETFNILNDYLQPSSILPVQSAAQAIDKLTPMKRDEKYGQEKESPESFMWETWGTFIEIAKQIPHHHASQDKLAGLVKVLSALPPTPVIIWDSEMKVWTDLPMLGPSMREAWVSPTFLSSQPDAKSTESWLNLNAFAARLMRDGSAPFQLFAIWGLRSALESGPSGRLELDCNVAVAAEWILSTGRLLYEKSRGDRDSSQDGATEGGPLYKGRPGLCPERWAFWKLRFGQISENDDVSERTKKMAGEARSRMEEIEKAASG